MASITKLPFGAYRVQIRRKGHYASETFLRRDDAHRWARQAETRVDQGLAPNKSSVSRLTTFGDLIDLHIIDMCEVGKPPRRSKAATLKTLKRDLGKEKIGHLDRQKLIDYGKMRADQGAGPVTLGIDIGVIKMIITHAAAVHGLDISPEPVDLARVALKRLGLIGKGTERDRRPTTDELNRLFRCFENNERLTLPMTRNLYCVMLGEHRSAFLASYRTLDRFQSCHPHHPLAQLSGQSLEQEMPSTDPMNSALRCTATAKTTRCRCKGPAVKGWSVCRMHGARGGAPSGPANGRWRHGNRTREAEEMRRELGELVREAREAAKALGDPNPF